jgi:site-specific DNA-adenine methylase
MEITKNKLVNCYKLIEEEPSNVIDKLKKYLDDNEYIELIKNMIDIIK